MTRTKKSLKGGLTEERRSWLCQPNQIETTMQLLSFVNYWAKSKDLLPQEDRESLYKVKTAILEAAYKEDRVSAVEYLDGLPNFLNNLKEWETIEELAEYSRIMLLKKWNQQDKAVKRFPGRPTNKPTPKKAKCPQCFKVIDKLSERIEHWKLEHNQTFLKADDVYWVLFERRKKKVKLNFRNLPLPNAKIYPKLTKAQAKKKRKTEEEGLTFKRPTTPAWSIDIIEKFSLENQKTINKIKAGILAQEEGTFNNLVKGWEKGQNTIIKKRENQKAKLASLLEVSTAELEKLILSKTELITALASWLKAHFNQAIQNRQPLDIDSLDTLGILPDHIFEYDAIDLNEDFNPEFYIFWDDLDKANLKIIDPEGYSLITFEYYSEQSYFKFHLPLRIAEKFISIEQLEKLKHQKSEKRKTDVLYGREITEAEALEFPGDLILQELGVDPTFLCF